MVRRAKSKAKAKKARKSKKARTRQTKSVRKTGRTGARKKATAKKPARAARHPDKRMPIPGDPNHELLCKWSTADNEYICKEVTIGGKWKKASAPPPATLTMAAAGGHPDKRVPIAGDPDNELLCKWSTSDNQYICREVPIGGNWP